MLLGAPRKERTRPIPSVWTLILRNSKRINLCSFKAPRWWHFLHQCLQTNYNRLWSERVVGIGSFLVLERGKGSWIPLWGQWGVWGWVGGGEPRGSQASGIEQRSRWAQVFCVNSLSPPSSLPHGRFFLVRQKEAHKDPFPPLHLHPEYF